MRLLYHRGISEWQFSNGAFDDNESAGKMFESIVPFLGFCFVIFLAPICVLYCILIRFAFVKFRFCTMSFHPNNLGLFANCEKPPILQRLLFYYWNFNYFKISLGNIPKFIMCYSIQRIIIFFFKNTLRFFFSAILNSNCTNAYNLW